MRLDKHDPSGSVGSSFEGFWMLPQPLQQALPSHLRAGWEEEDEDSEEVRPLDEELSSPAFSYDEDESDDDLSIDFPPDADLGDVDEEAGKE